MTSANVQHVSDSSVLSITPEAQAQLVRFRDAAPESAEQCLYARVTGVDGEQYRAALSIEPLTLAAPGDSRERFGDLEVVVAQDSTERLRGAVVQWHEAPDRSGFLIENPNRPTPQEALTERVREVIERDINPGIAMHGGRADLVAVEGRSAYVRLSGGCQGCGAAAATLAHGIEETLVEAVPEIADVVDVTNHAEGTNPYYEPAR
jgi:Fe/S biogenesis protein NfuA